jgi:protein-L-isoaspartate(D-aspartate) O-methyltransferase
LAIWHNVTVPGALVGAVGLLLAWPGAAQYDPGTLREQMVREQIMARGIGDAAVVKAMREVPRHLFVPDAQRQFAYEDHPLPIGYAQTISQPYIVAFMSHHLAVRKNHRVLEIGTGSGYQAAILAHLAAEVYTIEIVPELAARSSRLLAQLRLINVTVRAGDGYQGWPEKAPFDRIILTAAPEQIPPKLIEQLKPGGRLLAPVGPSSWNQELVLVEKAGDGTIRKRSILDVRFVPMIKGR